MPPLDYDYCMNPYAPACSTNFNDSCNVQCSTNASRSENADCHSGRCVDANGTISSSGTISFCDYYCPLNTSYGPCFDASSCTTSCNSNGTHETWSFRIYFMPFFCLDLACNCRRLGGILAGSSDNGTGCYLMFPNVNATWSDAEKLCQNVAAGTLLHGQLARFVDVKTWEIILGLDLMLLRGSEVWLGLRKYQTTSPLGSPSALEYLWQIDSAQNIMSCGDPSFNVSSIGFSFAMTPSPGCVYTYGGDWRTDTNCSALRPFMCKLTGMHQYLSCTVLVKGIWSRQS